MLQCFWRTYLHKADRSQVLPFYNIPFNKLSSQVDKHLFKTKNNLATLSHCQKNMWLKWQIELQMKLSRHSLFEH